MMRLICLTMLFFCLASQKPVVGANCKPLNLNVETIRGIEVCYQGYCFDCFHDRKSLSYEMTLPEYKKERMAIESRNEISKLVSLIDSMMTDKMPEIQNPYMVYQEINHFSGCCTDFHIEQTSGTYSPIGYLIIYFNNGQLPELIWYDGGLQFNNLRYLNRRYFKLLMNYIEELKKNHRERCDSVSSTIESWQDETPDYSDVILIRTYFLPDSIDATSRSNLLSLTRDDMAAYEMGLPLDERYLKRSPMIRGRIVSSTDVAMVLDAISHCPYERTLFYGSKDIPELSHIDRRGNLVWKDYGDSVIGILSIYRRSQRYPEYVWVSNDGIDRGYFHFKQTDTLRSLINKYRYPKK